jgi:hypothetical protein
MASARDALPERCETVLPSAYIIIWSAAMLDKDESAV